MSISIHMNGKPLSQVKTSLQKHIERDGNMDLKTLEGVVSSSGSSINMYETMFNQSLVRFDYSRSLREIVVDELNEVNKERKKMGLRAFRKDANIIGVATLQLSDETLDLMDYDKRQPPGSQGFHILRAGKVTTPRYDTPADRVVNAYKKMVNHMSEKPSVYGRILGAYIHFDEGSPHVDLVVMGIDRDNPTHSMRDILNGRPVDGKEPKRGQKLKEMQDDLASCFNEREAEKYDLRRGMSYSQRQDELLKLKKVAKRQKEVADKIDNLERTKKVKDAELSAIDFKLSQKRSEVSQMNSEVFHLREEKKALEDDLEALKNNLKTQRSALEEEEEELKTRKRRLRERQAIIDQEERTQSIMARELTTITARERYARGYAASQMRNTALYRMELNKAYADFDSRSENFQRGLDFDFEL